MKSAGVESIPEHVTPYDRFAWTDTDIEQLLISGEHAKDLIAYFGTQEYRELALLAKRGHGATATAGDARVIVVPGIMGSQLGLRRPAPLPHDILWLDPIDIQVGRLASLKLPTSAPIVPLGVVLYSYLRLKLQLRASGFAPVCHDYDWRLGIDTLGRALAQRVLAEPAEKVMIVAHSMGGLVSRAALTHPGMSKVRRVVLMGTPNFGSFAPLQALRGTYAVVRKIARLTSQASAESLADSIFNTFPSLYHMLPIAERNGGADLFDPREWPRSGPQPDIKVLRQARTVQEMLAPADARIATVVGVGQETVTAARRRDGEFVYTITRQGDGTVPAISAELPGAANYYASVAHSDLTRDAQVAAAVADILREGTTRALPTKWRSGSRAQAQIGDRQLQRTHVGKVDWAGLGPDERRLFLQNLNEPPKLRLRIPARQRVTSRATRSTKATARPKRAAKRLARKR